MRWQTKRAFEAEGTARNRSVDGVVGFVRNHDRQTGKQILEDQFLSLEEFICSDGNTELLVNTQWDNPLRIKCK